MPEGDTIWRTARSLQAALGGKAVQSFVSSLPVVTAAAQRLGIVGRVVEQVEARGKHLLIHFRGGPVLHTHQGMKGSWRLRRAGAPAQPRGGTPRAALFVDGAVATCSRSPVVELLSAREAARHPALGRLGPDLLDPDFDLEAARDRLRTRGGAEVGVALMDQTALAGIGNVYKSETLFLAGVSPRDRVEDLDDDTLTRVIATTRELMRRNLGTGERRTTSPLSPIPLWVYRRAGRPCRRCGVTIRHVVQGEQARSTYHCPGCQTPASRG